MNITLMKFSCSHQFRNSSYQVVLKLIDKVFVRRNGTFHALIAWVDFFLDEDSNWTTGYDVSLLLSALIWKLVYLILRSFI